VFLCSNLVVFEKSSKKLDVGLETGEWRNQKIVASTKSTGGCAERQGRIHKVRNTTSEKATWQTVNPIKKTQSHASLLKR